MSSQHSHINSPLPDSFIAGHNLKQKNSHNFIKHILKTNLPKSDSTSLDTDLKWDFVLAKHNVEDKKSKQIRKKKTFLIRKERKLLNLLKLPKNGWNYASLHPMREAWRQYMRENLDVNGYAPTCDDNNWTSFSTTLAKSELIGAELTVIRSTVPSLVGMSGTVVLETKSTFQIVTHESKIKTLLKEPSVFTFSVDNMKFIIFGKHIVTKPGDRSVKKIKSHILPDL